MLAIRQCPERKYLPPASVQRLLVLENVTGAHISRKQGMAAGGPSAHQNSQCPGGRDSEFEVSQPGPM